MAIIGFNRNYLTRNHPTGNDFLLANTGQMVKESISFEVEFDFVSSAALPVQVINNYAMQLLGDDWYNLGFTIGDSIGLVALYVDSSGTIQNIVGTGIIQDIQGDILTHNYDMGTSAVGQLFPSAPNNTVFQVLNSTTTLPQSIELFHNLVLNSSQGSRNSLLDGEVNRLLLTV